MSRRNDDIIEEIRVRLDMALVDPPGSDKIMLSSVERTRLLAVNDDLCRKLREDLDESERIMALRTDGSNK